MFFTGYVYCLVVYLISIFSLVFVALLISKKNYRKVEKKRNSDKGSFEAILDKLSSAIMIIDNKGFITFINLCSEDLLGLRRKEEIGKPIKEMARGKMVLDGLVSLPDFVLDGLNLGIVYQDVEVGALINGKHGTIKLTTRIISDQEEFKGVLVIFSDYTAEKLMKEQVQRNECLNAVGQMAAGICHEIRNPLQSIKGFIQLLQEKNKLDLDACTYVEIINSEISRISLIIKEFLQLARPSVTKFEKNDLNCLVREVVLLINSEAILRNVVIEESYGNKIPVLVLDEPRIKQVLINILSNALAAIIGTGTIQVSTFYDYQLNEWRIIISDNGVGMDQEMIKQIGSPFFTTKDEGTGLGLAVSHRIIQEHKGHIIVDSTLGKGSTFTIVLPELAEKIGEIRGLSA